MMVAVCIFLYSFFLQNNYEAIVRALLIESFLLDLLVEVP